MTQPPEAQERPALISLIASRQGMILALCIVALSALAWWWLWRMAYPAAPPMAPMPGMPEMDMGGMEMPGTDMAGMDMSGMMAGAPVQPWTLDYLGSTALMWAIMMVAMMLPSAAPMILLHDVFSRRHGLGSGATLLFALTYLLLWIAFAVLAAVAQAALVASGLVSSASLALGNERIAGALLVAAGLFEASPLKRACLSWCQSPVAFLTRYWRRGADGALVMGLRHGAYCIGCCGLLMLLLFVGGVMNLAWVGILALIVLAEKFTPPGWYVDRVLGVLLLLAGGVLILR